MKWPGGKGEPAKNPAPMPEMPGIDEILGITVDVMFGNTLSARRGAWTFTALPEGRGMAVYCWALRMWEVRPEGDEMVWFIAGKEFRRSRMTAKILFVWMLFILPEASLPPDYAQEAWREACKALNPAAEFEIKAVVGSYRGVGVPAIQGVCFLPRAKSPKPEPPKPEAPRPEAPEESV